MSKMENRAYIIIMGCVILWCSLILLPPLVAHLEEPVQDLSYYSYRCFSSICHQYETRSIYIFGHKLAVCARCSGIYFGALLGVILYPVSRFSRNWSSRTLWIISTLPMITDVILNVLDIHTSNIATRAITGAFFGAGSANILLPHAIEALTNILIHLSHNKGAQYESKTR